ncbi:MAG TPA: hypothetical protein VIM12_11505 [Noviherbaspirillum sp.]|jgi:hypothetical protein|uniref:hypothetical protein n=1 Tax=Noviherbaspirillum sp. TaxID=1926288 RepID=UPI002F93452A
MRTLIVAVHPDNASLLCPALAPAFRLRVCHTLPAVREALQAGDADGVVCGLHFDDGRLFSLLEALGAGEDSRRLPVLCVNAGATPLSAATRNSITISTGKLGARGFFDLGDARVEHGQARACAMLRDMVHGLLGAR